MVAYARHCEWESGLLRGAQRNNCRGARAGACARSVNLNTVEPTLLWLSSSPHCSELH